MNIIGAKEIALEIDKILGCDSEVCDFDDETVYVNTGEESLDFDELLKLRKKYPHRGCDSLRGRSGIHGRTMYVPRLYCRKG